VISLPARSDIQHELRLVREQAVARVTEVDLLVAALRDHIKDLQAERDWLRGELARVHEAHRLAGAAWMQRGQKDNRDGR
jgi:hypothetical protein